MAIPREVRLNVHALVHNSKTYNFSMVASAVADGASAGFTLRTADEDLHAVFEINAGGSARVMFYEAPSISASGDGMDIFNMNRHNIQNTTASAGGASPDFLASTGSILHDNHISGGGKHAPTGGAIRLDTEWILAKNQVYLFSACNLQGATTGMSFELEFYEH